VDLMCGALFLYKSQRKDKCISIVADFEDNALMVGVQLTIL
jgi:hypothetical protein